MNTKQAFHEVYANPPAVVKKTLLSKGKKQAKKQMIAIALSKSGKGK